MKQWTNEEDESLRAQYAKLGTRSIVIGRSYEAVKTRAKTLSLHVDKAVEWTDEMVSFLVKNYASNGASPMMKETLGLNKSQIVHKAGKLGLICDKSARSLNQRNANGNGANSKLFIGCGELSGNYIAYFRRNAKKRNIECPLLDAEKENFEYLWSLYLAQNKKCALSGIDLHLPLRRGDLSTASIDRIDSSKGYVKGNVQFLHKCVNAMKWAFEQEKFIILCHLITKIHPRSPGQVCDPEINKFLNKRRKA